MSLYQIVGENEKKGVVEGFTGKSLPELEAASVLLVLEDDTKQKSKPPIKGSEEDI